MQIYVYSTLVRDSCIVMRVMYLLEQMAAILPETFSKISKIFFFGKVLIVVGHSQCFLIVLFFLLL